MIFATVGTHHDGFPRMLSAVEQLPVSDLVVQHGPADPPSNAAVAKPFMPFDQVVDLFASAERVVTHAGVGSVLLAIRYGHVPIIVPRLHRLGEHLDDHQADLARRLEASGRVNVVWDENELLPVLLETPRRAEETPLPTTGLHAAVRGALGGAPAQAGSRGRTPARRRDSLRGHAVLRGHGKGGHAIGTRQHATSDDVRRRAHRRG